MNGFPKPKSILKIELVTSCVFTSLLLGAIQEGLPARPRAFGGAGGLHDVLPGVRRRDEQGRNRRLHTCLFFCRSSTSFMVSVQLTVHAAEFDGPDGR